MNTLLAAAAGEALFVLLSPFWVIIAGWTMGYAAHSLLVVIEQTAVGFDRVVWPPERTMDWFWKPFYVFGLLALWTALLAGVLVPLLPLEDAPALALTAALVWLLWPVSLLSSLSGSSRLLLLRWAVVRQLARCPRRTLAFYGATLLLPWPALLTAWIAVSGYRLAVQSLWTAGLDVLAEIGTLLVGLPLAGALLAASGLLYARLLGRLAWLAQLGGHISEAETSSAADGEVVEAVEVPAPPTEPLLATGPEPAAVAVRLPAPYAFAEEPLPLPPEAPPFRWEPGRMPPPAPPRSAWRDQPEAPRDLGDDKPERLPDGPLPPLLCRQVFHFPWYRSTVWPWLLLSMGFACAGLLARLMIAFR